MVNSSIKSSALNSDIDYLSRNLDYDMCNYKVGSAPRNVNYNMAFNSMNESRPIMDKKKMA